MEQDLITFVLTRNGINSVNCNENFEEKNRTFTSDLQRNEFFLIYSREYSIKIKLEENGMLYPSTMEEVIELFFQLGFLLQNINHTGNITLDLIIRPFPKVSDHFK